MSSIHAEQTTPPVFWKILACCSIVTNALCSGGIFTFPLMSPMLAERCRLSQPQLTTVALAAMMGQYPFAALAGKMIDQYGPSLCSVIAAVLYSSAFSSFSYHVYAASDPTASVSVYLTISFALAGMATVFSYFSFLFAASRLFPMQPGVATGTSMALFGLSPLFLTSVALSWFTNHYNGVFQVVRFTAYLAVVSGAVHLLGAITFSRAGLNSKDQSSASRDLDYHPDETSQLLPREERAEYIPELHVKTDTTLGFLKHGYLWLLIIFCICVFGASEMVISNIGTIVAALPPTGSEQGAFASTSVIDNTPRQVRLISMANTFTRICVGPLADYVSPVASYLPNGTIVHARKHRISRVSFLFVSAALLVLTFCWAFTGITTQEGLWVLSVGTGIGYSATFTVVPSIVSSVWGLKNLGRNFGILMYAPFVGTPIFSYFYAFVSQSHTKDNGICRGTECLQTTFKVTTITSLFALTIATALWRVWRGRL